MYGDGNQIPHMDPHDDGRQGGNNTYYYNDDEYDHPAVLDEPYNHNVIYEDEEDYAQEPNYNQPPPPIITQAPLNSHSMHHPIANGPPPMQHHQHQHHPNVNPHSMQPPTMDVNMNYPSPPMQNGNSNQPEIPLRKTKSRQSNGSSGGRDRERSKHQKSKSKKQSANGSSEKRGKKQSKKSSSSSKRNEYDADLHSHKGGKRKPSMSLTKKVSIGAAVLVFCVIITVTSLIFVNKSKSGKKNGTDGLQSQPSTNKNPPQRPVSTPVPQPTMYPTMPPTHSIPTFSPTVALDLEPEPVACPTVQEMIGACVGDGTNTNDDTTTNMNDGTNPNSQNNQNVPVSSPTTTETSQSSVTPPTTVEQTPTVNNVPSQAIVPCPTIQYILGTCGTRSPTLPPQTRAPVVDVPLESVCTDEKFQNKIFINEFHYKNQGFDFAEFIELVHSSTLNLSGFILEFYDGDTGMIYKRTDLGQTIPAVTSSDPNGGSITFSAYSQMNFHDGPAGIALVDPNGNVLQFIGYGDPSVSEVTFTAVNGAATGMTVSHIGVFEPEDSPLTSSLQLDGAGSNVGDFMWQMPNYGTPGKMNEGQVFLCD